MKCELDSLKGELTNLVFVWLVLIEPLDCATDHSFVTSFENEHHTSECSMHKYKFQRAIQAALFCFTIFWKSLFDGNLVPVIIKQ